jgi:hypothetical protein
LQKIRIIQPSIVHIEFITLHKFSKLLMRCVKYVLPMRL